MAPTPQPQSTTREALPTFKRLCESPGEFLGKLDIAALNVICASGLPGAEALSIPDLLSWIDDAAQVVSKETERNYDHFLTSPRSFGASQAKFCILTLVTVLQRKLGVRYNPKWEDLTAENETPREFPLDANDMFIHAIINGIGGTCGSLPVLYVAVGRRLGYPLKVVKAFRHLFVRWDDPGGKHWFHPDQFNIEATGPGVHFLPDDHYKTWPHQIPGIDVQAGIFLKSLTPSEELAEFLATRGYCLRDHRRWNEALEVFTTAAQLAPHNHYFERSRYGLMMRLATLRRTHPFVNAPVVGPVMDLPRGPHLVRGSNGQEILVQIPKPGHLEPPPFGLGWPLVPHLLQMPNGQIADVYIPVHGAGRQLRAEWLKLASGDFALVHRPAQNDGWRQPLRRDAGHRNGQPVLPDEGPIPHHAHPAVDPEMPPYERMALVAAIEQLRPTPQLGFASEGRHDIHAFAMPPGPIHPALQFNARSVRQV